jgi:four helix bundle protein
MNSEKYYKSFTDLEVWQKARAFKLDVYALVKTFPKEENFRLTDQLVRAARSIPANIAEGYGRYTYKDQLHFCVQARGSLFECMNHVIDALDCQYISGQIKEEYEEKITVLEKMLNGYMAWLKRMINEVR